MADSFLSSPPRTARRHPRPIGLGEGLSEAKPGEGRGAKQPFNGEGQDEELDKELDNSCCA